MSRSLAAKLGSLDSLNWRSRCGCKPWARQIPPLAPEIAELVLALTLGAPPDQTTHWTAPMMAKVVGIRVSSVQRMLEAFRVAQEERPGPVLLELPEDIAGQDVPDVPVVRVHPIDRPLAHPTALDRAAARS